MSSLSEPRRPRLLPQNRKLRHLKGLSLRNLSFAPVQLRTSDDVALIRSPNKLGALKEAGQLHGSRSSDNLRLEARPERSRSQPPRRTSLSTVSLSPAQRQKRLKELLDGTLGDVFFSLHVAGIDEPVYVSEVRERSAV